MALDPHRRRPQQAEQWEGRVDPHRDDEIAVPPLAAHIDAIEQHGADRGRDDIPHPALTGTRIGPRQSSGASTLGGGRGQGRSYMQCKGKLQHRECHREQDRDDEGELDHRIPRIALRAMRVLTEPTPMTVHD